MPPTSKLHPSEKPYGEDISLTRLGIEGMAVNIGKLEFADKGLPVPEMDELLRIAEERYESSIRSGSDDYPGTAKQNR